MADRDFERALRDADRDWAEQTVSPSVERHLRQRLRGGNVREEEPRPRARWTMGLAVTAAALLMLVLWPRSETAALAGFATPNPCPELRAHTEGAQLVIDGGHCALQEPNSGITVEVDGPARLSRSDDGVVMTKGHAVFDVEPRARRRRVAVSGGVIEILGTRFEVEERGDAGSVLLLHGSIRFVSHDGRVVKLAPGERLAWPLPEKVAANDVEASPVGEPPRSPETTDAPPEVAPEMDPGMIGPEEPSPGASSTESEPSDGEAPAEAAAGGAPPEKLPPRPRALMAEVAKLRSQGRFEEAAELLREVGPMPKKDRERLSYERGAMLTYRLNQKEAACAHWAAHQAQFPDGDYAVEVQLARRKLGCE